MPSALVLFEGLPGSGKTTSSRALADRYRDAGHEVGWALEEDRNHPFFGSRLKRCHRSPAFGEACLDAWREVARACHESPWIIEGCAFQSTVRFMFEQDWPATAIDEYWAGFVDIVSPLDPVFVHLRPRDVESFIRGHTKTVRAGVWDRIATHVRSTPIGGALEARGADTPVEFWVRYSELCDRLLEQSALSVLTIDVERGWSDVVALVARSAGPGPSSPQATSG